jgi:hypothetical protein
LVRKRREEGGGREEGREGGREGGGRRGERERSRNSRVGGYSLVKTGQFSCSSEDNRAM